MIQPIPPIRIKSGDPSAPLAIIPDEISQTFFEERLKTVSDVERNALFALLLSPLFAQRLVVNSTGQATSNLPLRIFPVEIRYPGNIAVVPPPHRFIYVVDSKAKAVLKVVKGDELIVPFRTFALPSFPGAPSLSDIVTKLVDFLPNGVVLDSKTLKGLKDFRDLRIYISSIELDDEGKKRLSKGHARTLDQVDMRTVGGVELGAGNLVFMTPEPVEWALDMRDANVEPAQENLNAFLSDSTRGAERFIAEALKKMIQQVNPLPGPTSNDPMGLVNELQDGQPFRFLREYETAHKAMRLPIDDAIQLLTTWFMSPAFSIQEHAAERIKGLVRDHFIQTNALIHAGWAEHPIAVLATEALLNDKERIITKILDPGPSAILNRSGTELFPAGRHTILALSMLASEYTPGWVRKQRLLSQAVRAKHMQVGLRQILNNRAVVGRDAKAAFEMEALTAAVNDPNQTLAQAQEMGAKRHVIFADAKRTGRTASMPRPKSLNRDVKLAELELSALEVAGIIRSTPATPATSAARFVSKTQGVIKHVSLMLSIVTEGFNVANAYVTASDPSKSFGDKAVAVVGSAADAVPVFFALSVRVAQLTKVLQAETLAVVEKRFARINPIIAMASAACDVYQNTQSARDALSKEHMHEAAGYFAAAGGSGFILVGATLQMALMSSPAFLVFANEVWVGVAVVEGGVLCCPVAGWIIGAGVVIVISAEVFITLAKRNEFEDFARHCFLGKRAGQPFGNPPATPSWAHVNWPMSRIEEARILMGLFSAFEIRVDPAQRDPRKADSRVDIVPHYIENDALIAIQVEIRGTNFRGDTEIFTGHLWVSPADYTVRQDPTDLMQMDLGRCRVEQNDEMQLKSFRLFLKPTLLRGSSADLLGAGIQFQVEADQPLADRLLGLHPQLHQAFPDGALVVVTGDVADIEQHQAGSLISRG